MDARLERGFGTRQGIVDAAGQLFAEHGFAAVSIESVLRACGISRGALYHHFASKEALFTAVLVTVEARIADVVSVAARGFADPRSALRAGCHAWLDLAAHDPAVRRVVLVDAPAVVGWAAWRQIDERFSLGLLKSALAAAATERGLPAGAYDLDAHVLLAVLVELALLIARADDAGETVARAREAVARVLDGLIGPPR